MAGPVKSKVQKKISLLISEGKKSEQAVAIAHSLMRRGKLK